jgi:GT2 family glycosyltransferase
MYHTYISCYYKNTIQMIVPMIQSQNCKELKDISYYLECITTQTYRNLEIIVSDNSTPNNAIDSIVEQFIKHDTRIRYFKQIENKGPVFNWNYVLKQATGEFFMWAADDDRWIPNYINCCVHEFLRQGDDLVSVKILLNEWRIFRSSRKWVFIKKLLNLHICKLVGK